VAAATSRRQQQQRRRSSVNTSANKSLQAKQSFGVAYWQAWNWKRVRRALADLVAGSKDDFSYQICLRSWGDLFLFLPVQIPEQFGSFWLPVCWSLWFPWRRHTLDASFTSSLISLARTSSTWRLWMILDVTRTWSPMHFNKKRCNFLMGRCKFRFTFNSSVFAVWFGELLLLLAARKFLVRLRPLPSLVHLRYQVLSLKGLEQNSLM